MQAAGPASSRTRETGRIQAAGGDLATGPAWSYHAKRRRPMTSSAAFAEGALVSLPYYPVNEFAPAMKGMVIGGVGIFHVFLAQFAIGGGMLMCYMQWLASRHGLTIARRFLDSYFSLLVLISFVLGALTGVGMWFTTIQVSPRTIGVMVDEFHWIWATEWTFFALEVVAGYTFYRYGRRLNDRSRMTLLVLYTTAAWFSLFWINGIISWQLTPGEWTLTRSVWDGFFNPTFLPSLLFRTVTSLTIAALVACVVVNAIRGIDAVERRDLVHRISLLLIPMAAMPFLGWWYFEVIPDDSRSWVMGGSVAMTLFFTSGLVASMLIGLYAVIGLVAQRLYINGATATLLCGLAFIATAGGEFVREGVRKPYTIRETLYSNSIRPSEIAELRRVGSVTHDPYPLIDHDAYPTDQLRLGARVYRFQCSVCHTMDGTNALLHLAGSWSIDQKRMNIAKLQHTKTFMPPFAGNAAEVEAVVQLINWVAAGRPAEWPTLNDRQAIGMIEEWLAEAGTEPGRAAVVHDAAVD
jgi:hypothetical protein